MASDGSSMDVGSTPAESAGQMTLEAGSESDSLPPNQVEPATGAGPAAIAVPRNTTTDSAEVLAAADALLDLARAGRPTSLPRVLCVSGLPQTARHAGQTRLNARC